MIKNKACLFLLINLIILQLLDFALTYAGVLTYGIKAEGNPLVHYLMKTFGILNGLMYIKALAIVLISILIARLPSCSGKNWLYFLILLNFIYFIAIGSWLIIFFA